MPKFKLVCKCAYQCWKERTPTVMGIPVEIDPSMPRSLQLIVKTFIFYGSAVGAFGLYLDLMEVIG